VYILKWVKSRSIFAKIELLFWIPLGLAFTFEFHDIDEDPQLLYR
jgi:hypothetical protein